ncbi:MAG: hypothetical protein GY953_03135 [bacterium]|nr:hypothetical protein [bacterium]
MPFHSHEIWRLRTATISRCRDLLVESNRYPWLRCVNRTAYRVMEGVIRQQFAAVPQVKTIYLGHGLALGELYPGLSDFDVFMVFEAADDAGIPAALRARWRTLSKFLPVRDIILFSTGEFDGWLRCGGGWEPRDEMRHWKCLHGEDRRPRIGPFEDDRSERDRIRFALAGFQKLVALALKEQLRSPIIRIVARRDLYRAFCQAVLPLDARYLEIGNQMERLRGWSDDYGPHPPVTELFRVHESGFRQGPISALQRSLASLAYRVLTDALGNPEASAVPPLPGYALPESPLPIANRDEVERRVRPLVVRISELVEGQVESVVLFSGGSCRGWQLGVIVRDDLDPAATEELLARLRLTFRIYDDPWFNEHYSEGVPMVFSRTMFDWYLRVWPSAPAYGAAHGCVLYGEDPYRRFPAKTAAGQGGRIEEEITGEWASLARYVRQVYLFRTKPALFDAVTLHVPRFRVLNESGVHPTTAEEAVQLYERLPGTNGDLPRLYLDRYEEMDIDALCKSMDDAEFESAWPFLERNFFDAVRRVDEVVQL